MNNLKQSFAVSVILSLTAVMALLASPSTRAQIAEQFSFGFASMFAGNTAEPVTVPSVTATDAFHFLEPLAPNSGDPEKFDASLLNYLTVEICAVSGSDCPVVKTFTAQDPGSEQLRIARSGRYSHYMANWDTQRSNFNNTMTYRVRVVVADLELGTIDLAPPQYISFGRTWPIKFLIEKDPELRVRIFGTLRRSCSQIAQMLKTDFGMSAEDVAFYMANDQDPCSQQEIDLAIRGVFQDVIMPDTTKIADEVTRNALTSFDMSTGTMTFVADSPMVNSLEVGDVLVSEPGPSAPYGYLRSITSRRKQGGMVTLETSQASLTEAFYEGTLEAAGELLPDDLESSEALLPGVTFREAASSESKFTSPEDVTGGYNFETNFDVTIDGDTGDGDFNGSGHVRISGRVMFNAGYDLGVGAELCAELPPVCVDRVEARVGVQQFSEVHVDGHLDATLRKELVVARHFFRPFTWFVGPIPVIIVPVVNIAVGVDGEAHVTFQFDATLASDFSIGAKWTDPGDGGIGWEDVSQINQFPIDGNATGNLTAGMRIDAYGRGNAKLLLYGVAGPGFRADIGAGGKFQLPAQPPGPVWTVYAHLSADVFFEVNIIDVIKLADVNLFDVLFKQEPVLARAPNRPPIFSNVRTEPIPARLHEPVYIGKRDSFGVGHYDVIDPENEGEPVLTASVNGVELAGFPNVTFTDNPGDKLITITATDIHGATETTQITVRIFNQPPTVEIWPSATTIPAGVQFFTTIIAIDPDASPPGAPVPVFVGCTLLDIQVDAPDVFVRHGGAGNCVAWVRFNQVGLRELRVAATDPAGATVFKTISVNVTAAPANPYPEIAESDASSTFSVMANRGPFSNVCPDVNFLCEAPSGVFLNNGQAHDNSPYQPPLFMSVITTDPTDTVLWRCEVAGIFADITFTQHGASCNPVASMNPIMVYAVVTDSSGQSIRSEQRNYRMLQRNPN